MAISINRVYTTVQSILNIEQRGQLPAQDFNHIARLAQLDIFNKLFYDEPYYSLHPKAGDNSLLNENIQQMQDILANRVDLPKTGGRFDLELEQPLYKLEAVYYDPVGNGSTTDFVVVEKLQHRDYAYVNHSPLTMPTTTFPKYLRYENVPGHPGVGSLEVFPATIDNVYIDYIREPVDPSWDSFTLGDGSGLPVFAGGQDFELHPSLEQDLVHRILIYAGLSIRQEEVSNAISSLANQDEQLERS